VLIVHDDSSYVDQLKQALETALPGVEVMSALSAPRALGIVAQVTPSVIVVDAELVGVDGYSLTQQLKADIKTSAVPIVILSLSPNESTALKARQAGASAHLSASGSVEPVVSKIAALAASDASGTSGQSAVPSSPATARPAQAPSTQPAAVPRPPGQMPAGAAAGGPSMRDDAPVPLQSVATSAGAAVSERPVVVPPGYGAAQIEPPTTADATPRPMPVTPAGYGAPQPVSAAPSSGASAAHSGPGSTEIPHIDDLLRIMLQRGGSDLHITVGSPPGIRQRGEIVLVENMKPLTPRDTMEMILGLLSEEQRRRFETELELDFAYSIPGVSRFRANVFQQRNSMGAVFRVIPINIPTMDDLALPKVCRWLADRPRGLVLVTGPTGSGKSTTLAAMIDHINESRPVHIITLEDPIEFMHRNKKSFVNQREIGEDTHSFASALKRVLRQDPDVILVGEMRDLETISAAITAAETGHLVLATLHTTGGPETIDRVVDVFPPHQQQQVRMQLSNTLEGVLSQVLLRSTDGRSRVMAMEIMLGIPAISNLIREGKTHQMETIIQGGATLGMQTLDQHLKTLLSGGKVTFEEAIGKAKNPRELAAMLGRKL
jgi:twitching motility protein PilT